MTELCEGVAVGVVGDKDPTCPFCEGKGPIALRNLKTKHGTLKKERRLHDNLESDADISSEDVGPVLPTPGGGEKHAGWVVAEGVFEDFEVEIPPAPHHLIPGKAAMAPSSLEQWTCESKGKILQDIGYNIDGALNGIFLPHLPHIHFTRHFQYINAAGQTRSETKVATSGKRAGKTVKKTFADVFGAWGDLPAAQRNAIAYLVMNETWLQMHYTDHDDPYVHVDNDENYDEEVKERCNALGDLMQTHFVPRCPNAPAGSDKFYPPYGLVARINRISQFFKTRITGRPSRWESWVSPLAQDFTQATASGQVPLITRFLIRKK